MMLMKRLNSLELTIERLIVDMVMDMDIMLMVMDISGDILPLPTYTERDLLIQRK